MPLARRRPRPHWGGLLCLLTIPAAAGGQTSSSSGDPLHPPPVDTLAPLEYDGWKQYRLLCDRCHGEEARGTSFGPDLLAALRPTGAVPSREAFIALLLSGRPDRGMPPAAQLGLAPETFDGLYLYLRGRSEGRYRGGRPARQEVPAPAHDAAPAP